MQWVLCASSVDGIKRYSVKGPRSRNGFVTKAVEAYQRRSRSVDQLIMTCFVLGMGTRKVSVALLFLLGKRVSASVVSRVKESLDQEVKRYYQLKPSDRYRFLFINGVAPKHKGAANVQKGVILCVFGETGEKKREMIDFLLASSESQNAWKVFLRDLYERGLDGRVCELIVADGEEGLGVH